jgi:uncharacterized membrane protein YphA (DoxX/SURF4 family)
MEESRLRRLFSTFPSNWPGVGLLLLRALVGCSLLIQGVAYVQSPNGGLAVWGAAALEFASGAFLLAGLMTPFVAVLAAIGSAGIALSWMPLPLQSLFDSYLAIINQVVLCIAIALLGPGAFSLDARMFGRREITIPSNSHISRP